MRHTSLASSSPGDARLQTFIINRGWYGGRAYTRHALVGKAPLAAPLASRVGSGGRIVRAGREATVPCLISQGSAGVGLGLVTVLGVVAAGAAGVGGARDSRPPALVDHIVLPGILQNGIRASMLSVRGRWNGMEECNHSD